jgi:parallel beta-helix repeat protein
MVLTAIGLCAAPARAQCVVPTDGMVITQNTTFCSGTYYLPNGITIGASNITISGSSTTLYGDNTTNKYGVRATARAHVTIQNLTVRTYYHGLHLQDCDDLTILRCNVWDTPDLPQGAIFLNIFDGPTGSYGYAMWLRYCDRFEVSACNVSGQQNGICMFDCTYANIHGNFASDNSGWGISLYNTDYSTIADNIADRCTRDYGGWSGADAASLLMVYGSSNNTITGNSLVGGGDGVFLAGATGSLQSQPNNYNYFANNDCSESPNNGFESTFSQYNVFEQNISDRCNYGYWMGYSSLSTVRNNQINDNRTDGIAIEHGHSNVIEQNRVSGNPIAIDLWTDDDASLVAAFPTCRDSYDYDIRNNTLTYNSVGVNCTGSGSTRLSHDYRIYNNIIDYNNNGISFSATTTSNIYSNLIRHNTGAGVNLGTATNNTVYNNYLKNTVNARATASNTWSIAKTAGTNIVGGAYLGGNYWSDYTGTDTDGDGQGNTNLPHRSGGTITTGGDSRPLVMVGPDCNENGIPDATEPDCNGDGIPNDCSADCNGNGLPDECEIVDGTVPDCNGNGVPDECDVAYPVAITDAIPGYNTWLDVRNLYNLNLQDNAYTTITLPFTNALFNTPAIYVHADGVLGWGPDPNLAQINEPLPSASVFGGQHALLALWDDLGIGGGVYWGVVGNTPNRTIVVMWSDRKHAPPYLFADGNGASFEAQIFETPRGGNVYAQVRYQDLDFKDIRYDNGASATVGFQSGMLGAVQWSYNLVNRVTSGSVLSLLFTPSASADENSNGIPDECEGRAGDLNCDGLVNNGDIDAFVLALTDPGGYQQAYPNCTVAAADMNGDSLVNNGDIDGFVSALTGQ